MKDLTNETDKKKFISKNNNSLNLYNNERYYLSLRVP